MKAFRDAEGRVRIFRPYDNANRMARSAEFGFMPAVPEELFVEGVRRCVETNLEYIPPKETGGAFYIRPLLIGTGPFIGMGAATEFTYLVFGMPVGAFYTGGVKPVDAIVIEDFDRSKLWEKKKRKKKKTSIYDTYVAFRCTQRYWWIQAGWKLRSHFPTYYESQKGWLCSYPSS
jgi:branched-subunit amino acid aminotransferase/4-amino-4-deoxychorismate lyase